MKFCEYCQNMLYIIIDSEKCLKYQCKNCNFDKQITTNDDTLPTTILKNTYIDEEKSKDCNECVMNINYADDARNYNHYLNKNIKFDKTLPHVNNIKCLDKTCTKETDTIYIKYDHNNMKYLYFCCNCESFWK
jgi:hypothetical protein